MHTMRSAFKRWLVLHEESYRCHGYVRIPNWFRFYIRKNKIWEYVVTNRDFNHCSHNESSESKRRFKGQYQFEISDDELLALKRAEWIK